MPTNWNVRRPPAPSVAELNGSLAALRVEALEALRHDGGEHARRYRQALENIARTERMLEAAEERQKRRERDEQRTAKEIVDEVMGG